MRIKEKMAYYVVLVASFFLLLSVAIPITTIAMVCRALNGYSGLLPTTIPIAIPRTQDAQTTTKH